MSIGCADPVTPADLPVGSQSDGFAWLDIPAGLMDARLLERPWEARP